MGGGRKRVAGSSGGSGKDGQQSLNSGSDISSGEDKIMSDNTFTWRDIDGTEKTFTANTHEVNLINAYKDELSLEQRQREIERTNDDYLRDPEYARIDDELKQATSKRVDYAQNLRLYNKSQNISNMESPNYKQVARRSLKK